MRNQKCMPNFWASRRGLSSLACRRAGPSRRRAPSAPRGATRASAGTVRRQLLHNHVHRGEKRGGPQRGVPRDVHAARRPPRPVVYRGHERGAGAHALHVPHRQQVDDSGLGDRVGVDGGGQGPRITSTQRHRLASPSRFAMPITASRRHALRPTRAPSSRRAKGRTCGR